MLGDVDGDLLEPFGGGLECDDPSRNVFDIHGGGIDLVFPHHENEIAQSCCAFGLRRMANIWMHNGFLQVESQKMSKSLGNFVTIHELLRTTRFGGASGPAMFRGLRCCVRTTATRSTGPRRLEEAQATLEGWYQRSAESFEPVSEPDPRCSSSLCTTT